MFLYLPYASLCHEFVRDLDSELKLTSGACWMIFYVAGQSH